MTATDLNARKLPGDLEFLTPNCPICAEYTDAVDGGLSCFNCGVAWDGDGTNPERINPDAVQCPSLYTIQYRHARNEDVDYRCWQDAGHAGDHHSPEVFYSWSTAEQTGEAGS